MSSKVKTTVNVALQNQLIEWINNAGLSSGGKRVELLRKIIEVLVHSADAAGVDVTEHLESVLSYATDKSADVKKQVISFIEEISKEKPHLLPYTVSTLRPLVLDSVIAVQKRAIQAASIVYRNALMWICKADDRVDVEDLQVVWKQLSELKLIVLNMIDSENEGIRTHSIKFLEEVVLLQTEDEDILVAPRAPFIDIAMLREEAEHIFTLLVKFHNSQHISSVNLMACMTSLCGVARARPPYTARVLRALRALHDTLPPTLSASQVNSVRKHLRMLLMNLAKLPTLGDSASAVAGLLSAAGVPAHEIQKALPSVSIPSRRRRERHEPPAKRLKKDDTQEDSSDFVMFDEDSGSQPATSTATEESILEGLDNVESVISLVTDTLVNKLPADMPLSFMTAYEPIPDSGSKAQKKKLARMIAQLAGIEVSPVAQVTQVVTQVTPVVDQVTPVPVPAPVPPPEARIPLLTEEEDKVTLRHAVAKLQESARMEEARQDHLKAEEKKDKPVPPQTPTVPKLKQKVKLLKLQELARPLSPDVRSRLADGALERMLKAERSCQEGGAHNAQLRLKLVALLAATAPRSGQDLVIRHVLEEPSNRLDLALHWLYEEYAFMQGFNRLPVTLPKLNEKPDENYNRLLCSLVTQLFRQWEESDSDSGTSEALVRRMYSEAPLVTEEAAEFLRHAANSPKAAPLALDILEELCATRPPRAHKYVPALLAHTLSADAATRSRALAAARRLHARGTDSVGGAYVRLAQTIVKHAALQLGYLALPTPPVVLPRSVMWTDELYRIAAALIVEILPQNEELIVEIGVVYGRASPEARRVVGRAVEGRLRGDSSDPDHHTPGARVECEASVRASAAALMAACPRGAETLLTRLVHMLTEKERPSQELVSRVRSLYASRGADVRFLIPVLTGLHDHEIFAALPKLIKLNPAVVKEVFNKLLGLQGGFEEDPPVNAEDLLVELHNIDPSSADLKYIIKATAICFAEKHIYTQDVIAGVLQRLSSQQSLPVLLMRSVLQALTLYPALAPLVTDILVLLIDKEVWNNKVAWEGWVKCLQRLLPGAATVLTGLPPAGLGALPPVLRQALAHHVASITPAERAKLPPHVPLVLQEAQYAPGAPLTEPLPPGME